MDSILDEHRKKVWDARADAVSRALSHAWDGYLKYAWNSDELKPVSKSGDSWLHMGLTIIDALDTAWVLGNKTIFDKAVDWVVREKGLTMDADVNANVFETTIRVVGGLLSAYDLSKDDRLFKEAVRVADKFLPAFDTTSGIPFNSINLKSGKATNPGGTYSSTSEATTVQLEMKYLSHLTGDPKYWNAAQKVSKVLFQSPSDKTDKYDGLVPVYLDKTSGNFIGTELRLGSRADSYYEYLAKQYLQTNETEPFFLQQYRKALHKGIKKHLLMRSEPSNLLYIREYNGNLGSGTISEKFDHLVCYFGGTLALTATKGKRVPTDIEGRKKVLTGIEMEELYLGEELARSCYEMYHQTATGLASEIVFWKPAKDQVGTKKEFERTWSRFESFNSEAEAKESTKTKADLPIALELVRDVTHDDLEHDFSIHPMDLHNLLRPEAIETFFVLYRITGDEKYREWGWRMFRSFEQWTKVETGGYTIADVVDHPPAIHPRHVKATNLSVFEDSALLPIRPDFFNHNFPVFLEDVDGLSDVQKKQIWSDRTKALGRAFSHEWERTDAKHGISSMKSCFEIMDALDAALIFDNKTIYEKVKAWIVNGGLHEDKLGDAVINVHDAASRILGSLLSAYHLSGKDNLFLNEAVRVGNKILKGFKRTETGLPVASINWKTGKQTSNYTFTTVTKLSSSFLELAYLSKITSDPKYLVVIDRVTAVVLNKNSSGRNVPLQKQTNSDLILPQLNINSGGGPDIFSLNTHRFLDTILKLDILTKNSSSTTNLREIFQDSMHTGVKKHLLARSSPSGLLYTREHHHLHGKTTEKKHRFEHSACAISTALALSSTNGGNGSNGGGRSSNYPEKIPRKLAERKKIMSGRKLEELYIAQELARTCFEMYHQSATGIAADAVLMRAQKDQVGMVKELDRTWAKFEGKGKLFDAGRRRAKTAARLLPVANGDTWWIEDGAIEVDFDVMKPDSFSLVRPEAVEAFFVLFRITGEEKYREWGWRIFRAYEQWAKIPGGGYANLVSSNPIFLINFNLCLKTRIM
ncbi:mannosyl-oligosaccharide alpha-1,2-mannosidase [Physocladia obscura]|uniref:alpha-1,2-Mannosidase n=1 Tax=Physocladia obscura TaxID=109957 RepID=A0AAD5XKR4_9FUNG|nr:mannosyl-oligosaccharide alpha-1,2-mannosidase [Physocladia obscura]